MGIARAIAHVPLPHIPDGNIGFIVAGGTPAGRRPPPQLQDTKVAGVVLITL